MLRTEYVSAILRWMPFFNGMMIRGGCAEKVASANNVTFHVPSFLRKPETIMQKVIPFLEIKNTCLPPITFVLFLEGATCVPPVGNTCLRDWCPGATPYRAFSLK